MKLYLFHRKQFVQINGEKSSLINDTVCVPQDCIFVRLLFLLFINDLSEAMNNFDIYGYADDFKTIIRGQNDLNQAKKNNKNCIEDKKRKQNFKESHVLNAKCDMH